MIGARAIGGVLLALGVVALVASLGVGDGWAASGPRLAPAVSSVLLIVLSAAFLVWPGRRAGGARRGGGARAPTGRPRRC